MIMSSFQMEGSNIPSTMNQEAASEQQPQQQLQESSPLVSPRVVNSKSLQSNAVSMAGSSVLSTPRHHSSTTVPNADNLETSLPPPMPFQVSSNAPTPVLSNVSYSSFTDSSGAYVQQVGSGASWAINQHVQSLQAFQQTATQSSPSILGRPPSSQQLHRQHSGSIGQSPSIPPNYLNNNHVLSIPTVPQTPSIISRSTSSLSNNSSSTSYSGLSELNAIMGTVTTESLLNSAFPEYLSLFPPGQQSQHGQHQHQHQQQRQTSNSMPSGDRFLEANRHHPQFVQPNYDNHTKAPAATKEKILESIQEAFMSTGISDDVGQPYEDDDPYGSVDWGSLNAASLQSGVSSTSFCISDDERDRLLKV
jgi:hypothetical protein